MSYLVLSELFSSCFNHHVLNVFCALRKAVKNRAQCIVFEGIFHIDFPIFWIKLCIVLKECPINLSHKVICLCIFILQCVHKSQSCKFNFTFEISCCWDKPLFCILVWFFLALWWLKNQRFLDKSVPVSKYGNPGDHVQYLNLRLCKPVQWIHQYFPSTEWKLDGRGRQHKGPGRNLPCGVPRGFDGQLSGHFRGPALHKNEDGHQHVYIKPGSGWRAVHPGTSISHHPQRAHLLAVWQLPLPYSDVGRLHQSIY